MNVAQWYSAQIEDPPSLNAVYYGWEADDANTRLISRNMEDEAPYGPEYVLKLVRFGCA